jgi:hypothetical protein
VLHHFNTYLSTTKQEQQQSAVRTAGQKVCPHADNRESIYIRLSSVFTQSANPRSDGGSAHRHCEQSYKKDATLDWSWCMQARNCSAVTVPSTTFCQPTNTSNNCWCRSRTAAYEGQLKTRFVSQCASHHLPRPSRNHTRLSRGTGSERMRPVAASRTRHHFPVSTSRSCAANRNADRARTLLLHMPAVRLTYPGPPFHRPRSRPPCTSKGNHQAQQTTAGTCSMPPPLWGLCEDRQAGHSSSRRTTSQTLQACSSHQDEPGHQPRASRHQALHQNSPGKLSNQPTTTTHSQGVVHSPPAPS